MDHRDDTILQHRPTSRPLNPQCSETTSSQEPKLLSGFRHPIPQRLGRHLAPCNSTIREAHNPTRGTRRNRKGSLRWRVHGTESMAKWFMVAYNEKGCSLILSTVRFVSTHGATDRASSDAAPTHPPVRTISKVGVRLCGTFQTSGSNQ